MTEANDVNQDSSPEQSQAVETQTSATGSDYVPSEQLTDGAQRRINQLVFQREEEKRRANELEERLSQLEAKAQQPAQQTVKTEEDFNYDSGAYAAYLAEEKANQIVEQRLTQFQNKQQQDAAAAEMKQLSDQFHRKQAEYAAQNPQYADLYVQGANAITSENLAGYLLRSENSVKLHEKLLSNPSELFRIQSLPNHQQNMELAKMDAVLSLPQQQPVSSAPDPVDSLQGGAGTASKALNDMSMAEYAASRGMPKDPFS